MTDNVIYRGATDLDRILSNVGMSNEEYHASSPIGKSGLWTIHMKTPLHFREGEKKDSNLFDPGTATHTAILEPEYFEARTHRGPEDRRGNKWTEAEVYAHALGVERGHRVVLLRGPDYDDALRMRDAAHRNPSVRALVSSGKAHVEASAFWVDPVTGIQGKCRPDIANVTSGLLGDYKTTDDASERKFARIAAQIGYHAQEAWYTQGWRMAGGFEPQGFVFMVQERASPFQIVVYEMDHAAVEEGARVMRNALNRYADCVKTNTWPGYPEQVQPITLPMWAYETEQE